MNSALSVCDMSVKIGKNKEILRHINFELGRGEICAILGANGSGKSTLLRAILGVLPYSGSVKIFNQECHSLSNLQRSKILSYVPQSQHISFPFTLLEVVMMGAFAKSAFVYRAEDSKKAFEALELLSIAHLASQKFSTLSGGQKQLGLIARALVQDSPIIVLDEPVSALDMSYAFRLLEILSTLRDKSIVITSHHPDQCFIAQRILMLKKGELFAFGNYDEILRESTIDALYGVTTQSVMLPNGGRYFCPLNTQRFSDEKS